MISGQLPGTPRRSTGNPPVRARVQMNQAGQPVRVLGTQSELRTRHGVPHQNRRLNLQRLKDAEDVIGQALIVVA